MKTEIKPFTAGIFAIVAIVIAVLCVMVLGSGKIFEEKREFVVYFDGSLKGLDIGAPVTYQGVRIGEVKDIQLLMDGKTLDTAASVYLTILPDKFQKTNGPQTSSDVKENIRRLVEKGLCAQLTVQSLVAGKLMVELDFEPNNKTKVKGHQGPEFELPSIQSGMEKFQETIENIPITEIANRLASALEGIDKQINSTDMQASFKNFSKSLNNLESLLKNADKKVNTLGDESKEVLAATRKLLEKLDKRVDATGDNLDKTLDEFKTLAKSANKQIDSLAPDIKSLSKTASNSLKKMETSVSQAEKLIKNLQQAYSVDSPFNKRLNLLLTDLSKTSLTIKELVNFLKDNPEALLRGKQEN